MPNSNATITGSSSRGAEIPARSAIPEISRIETR